MPKPNIKNVINKISKILIPILGALSSKSLKNPLTDKIKEIIKIINTITLRFI